MDRIQKKAIKAFKKLFPKADLTGQLVKLEEELREFKADNSVEELADVCIVCYGLMALKSEVGAFVLSFIVEELEDAEIEVLEQVIEAKIDVNLSRKWEYKDGKYHHV